MSKSAVLWDARYARHQMGPYHVECPERILVLKEILDGGGVGRELVNLDPRRATREELAHIHDEDYISRIADTEGKDMVALDVDTSTCADTWDTALLAAGGAIRVVEEVNSGKVKNAFAFVRPPGHHAERGRAMGFCIFNNIAIAVDSLIRKGGAERAAIVDIDVHHGNGTQHTFYERDDVFFASVHRSSFYPGSGYAEETGSKMGKGSTLNVPLDVGSGDDEYKRVFDTSIIPAVRSFDPQFIAVSVGFDAHQRDPLGGMNVTTDGYRWMGKTLCYLAEECCAGKLMFILEGGYDLIAIRDASEAMLEEMVSS